MYTTSNKIQLNTPLFSPLLFFPIHIKYKGKLIECLKLTVILISAVHIFDSYS